MFLSSPSTRRPAWERDDVVRYYERTVDLQAPEAAVLAALERDLHRMAVLDIGVGAGRTTLHLARRARRYTGVDSAPRMVDTCIARFGEDPPRRTFVIGDARSLPMFEDDTFDLVLFSFNGIDYVAEGERVVILAEMRRLARPGAHVVFSTHNLSADIEDQFAMRHAASWKGAVKQIVQQAYFHALNPGFRLRRARRLTMTINDGAHWFAFRTCYTKPAAQVAQLDALGYRDVRVLGLDGRRVSDAEIGTVSDPWLYYWARVE